MGGGSGTVKNCYNYGTVSGTIETGATTGTGSCSVNNCYYLENCGATRTGTSQSAEQFKTLASTLGSAWEDCPLLGRPILKDNPEISGTGSKDDPYLIPDLATLEAFQDYINTSSDHGEGKTFKLTADIDLSSKYGEGKQSWTPIGNDDAFAGNFDGAGHTISGLYIEVEDKSFSACIQGLFGTNLGTISNLNVDNVQITVYSTGYAYVGCIVGVNADTGTVTGCSSEGKITATSNLNAGVGGIVGQNAGTVTDCKSAVNVSVTVDTEETNLFCAAGGIVGINMGSNMIAVESCSNSGSVSCESSGETLTGSGGIVGINLAVDGEVTVESCSNSGSVSLSGSGIDVAGAGGIVGLNIGLTGKVSGTASVTNCFNTGEVTNSVQANVNGAGGIAGVNAATNQDSKAEVANCYSTGSVTGTGDTVSGAVVGINTDEMPGSTVTNTYYLDTASSGVGDGDDSGTTAMSSAQFASGEVAYLLGKKPQVWGQTVGTGTPELTADPAKTVYQITGKVDGQDDIVWYSNSTATLPAAPEKEGYTFEGWSTTENGSVDFKAGTEVTDDIIVYAIFKPEEPEVTDGTGSVSMADYTCGDTAPNPVAKSDTNGTRGVTFSYKPEGAPDSAYTAEKPTEPGDYIVRAVFPANEKYNAVVATAYFSITHQWGDWIIVVEPTETEGGRAIRNCVNRDNSSPDTVYLPSLSDTSVWTKGSRVDPTPGQAGYQTYTSRYGTVRVVLPALPRPLQGTVTKDGDPVRDASVTLKQGSTTYEAATDSRGNYVFDDVPPGIYEVVVEEDGKTSTSMMVVTGEANEEHDLTVSGKNVSSVLDGSQAKDTVLAADGLDAVAEEHADPDGEPVTVTLTVSEETKTSAEHAEAIQDAAGSSCDLDFYEIGIEKKTPEETAVITETKAPVTVILRFDFTGKRNIVVYRFHEGDVDVLTEKANPYGEYIELDASHGIIRLHVCRFCTYAIGYTDDGTNRYPVFPETDSENGQVASRNPYAAPGDSVTLSVVPDAGYDLGTLTVTDKDGKTIPMEANEDGTYTFTMPDSEVSIEASFIPCPSLTFPDLDPTLWYHKHTDYVITHGLMQGTPDGLFVPDGTVTRAQMVTLLWNLKGKPVVDFLMAYPDVDPEAWYAEAVRWATSEQVVAGYGDGTFGPNDPITREQMAAMLYNFEKKYGDGGFTGTWMYRLPFNDLDQISDWAFEAVAWCNMNGVITGKENSLFDPKGQAPRAEMAAILTLYCEMADAE